MGTAMFTDKDEATDNPAFDSCSRRVSGCKCRFGEETALPFGGFPSASMMG